MKVKISVEAEFSKHYLETQMDKGQMDDIIMYLIRNIPKDPDRKD